MCTRPGALIESRLRHNTRPPVHECCWFYSRAVIFAGIAVDCRWDHNRIVGSDANSPLDHNEWIAWWPHQLEHGPVSPESKSVEKIKNRSLNGISSNSVIYWTHLIQLIGWVSSYQKYDIFTNDLCNSLISAQISAGHNKKLVGWREIIKSN